MNISSKITLLSLVLTLSCDEPKNFDNEGSQTPPPNRREDPCLYDYQKIFYYDQVEFYNSDDKDNRMFAMTDSKNRAVFMHEQGSQGLKTFFGNVDDNDDFSLTEESTRFDIKWPNFDFSSDVKSCGATWGIGVYIYENTIACAPMKWNSGNEFATLFPRIIPGLPIGITYENPRIAINDSLEFVVVVYSPDTGINYVVSGDMSVSCTEYQFNFGEVQEDILIEATNDFDIEINNQGEVYLLYGRKDIRDIYMIRGQLDNYKNRVVWFNKNTLIKQSAEMPRLIQIDDQKWIIAYKRYRTDELFWVAADIRAAEDCKPISSLKEEMFGRGQDMYLTITKDRVFGFFQDNDNDWNYAIGTLME